MDTQVRHQIFEQKNMRSIFEEIDLIGQRQRDQSEGVDEPGVMTQTASAAMDTQQALLIFEGLKRLERQVEAMWDLQSLRHARAKLERIDDIPGLNLSLRRYGLQGIGRERPVSG